MSQSLTDSSKLNWRELPAEAKLQMLGRLRRMPTPGRTVESIRVPGLARDLTLRGGAWELWQNRSHEVILSGPAETGKTWACCQKLDALMWEYPGSHAAIVRKVLSSLYTSVLATYRGIISSQVKLFGGERPQWADYPNGSRVYFAGMDNPQKTLSSERDYVYVNQAEELTLEDWETLTTRCTGRAGNAPWSQIFGDCNPGSPSHWIRTRASAEKLRLLESRHEDNPTLYDERGELTAQGRMTMSVLDSLTGVRRDRLRFGRWVQAEGGVYEEWDRALHLIPWSRLPNGEIPPSWRRIRSIDFGYTNPFVCQWWAMDHDGRMYLYREIYRTGRLVSDHAAEILRLSGNERFEATVADHDAEDRATLNRCGISTLPAWKSISPGIQAVQRRLRKAGDGRPRIFVMDGALTERDASLEAARKPMSTEQEFEVYQWPKDKVGKPVKEVPDDRDNHGMDAMRYAVAYADQLGAHFIAPKAGGRKPMLDRIAAGPGQGGRW